MSSDSPAAEFNSRRVLGAWDAISLILGIVIGTSIFRSTKSIYGMMPGVGSTLLLWIAGGILSILGALCFAELAAAWPERGGDVAYLSRAFGTPIGYLLGWCRILVVIPSNVGIMSFAFQDYLREAGDIGPGASPWIALSAVIAMTVINLSGIQSGRRAQNLLTGSKVAGFCLVAVAGLVIAMTVGIPAQAVPLPNNQAALPGVALIFILYAFGGWNDAVYIAREMKDPQRDLPRALSLGVTAVLVVYLVVNLAYATLGIENLRSLEVPAQAVAERGFGRLGGLLVSGLMMVSALGAMHGTIFGGTRLAAAMGENHRSLSWLGYWSPGGSPTRAVWLIGVISVLMVFAFGTAGGQTMIDTIVKRLGARHPIPWNTYDGGFGTLVASTAPLFWAFFILAGLAQFRLRATEPDTLRPFRTPGYPVTPLIFIGTSGYMLFCSIQYAGWLSLIGILPLLLGWVGWQWERRTLSHRS